MKYKYTLSVKRMFTDGQGLILAVGNSKKKLAQYVRENYPNFKRDSSQDSWDDMAWVDEGVNEIMLLENYEIEVV